MDDISSFVSYGSRYDAPTEVPFWFHSGGPLFSLEIKLLGLSGPLILAIYRHADRSLVTENWEVVYKKYAGRNPTLDSLCLAHILGGPDGV